MHQAIQFGVESLQWESLQLQCFFSAAAPLRTAVGQPHSHESKRLGRKSIAMEYITQFWSS